MEPIEPDLATLAAEIQALEVSILRDDFASFYRAGWHVLEPSTPLVWGWAIETVCQHLQAVIEDWGKRQTDHGHAQRIRDFLATLPPGTAKSRALVFLVPWAWLRWPSMRVIALSCNPRVALRDSMYARDVIGHLPGDWYQRTFRPSWTVRSDSDAKGLFTNSAGGFRSAMGIDARIVGERGDLILVDDPHDPEQVESDAQREHVLERWDSSIANRTNDISSSIRIGIAQRTHEADWSSARIAEGWTHLDLPMLYEPERECVTPLGRPDPRTVEGECIDPVRFPPDELAKLRTTKAGSELRWATLYQGRPAPAGGALVKLDSLRWHRAPGRPEAANVRPRGSWLGPSVETPTDFQSVTIAADLAMGKATKDGDYNVIVAVGKCGGSFYLLDVWRKRADFPDVQAAFRSFASRWPHARKVVEAAAAGRSLETSLRAEIPGLIGVPPQGSKIQRMHAVLAFFEAGNVHFDEYMPDLDALVTELITMPNARHDDFPDALSLALAQATVHDRRPPRPGWVGSLHPTADVLAPARAPDHGHVCFPGIAFVRRQ